MIWLQIWLGGHVGSGAIAANMMSLSQGTLVSE